MAVLSNYDMGWGTVTVNMFISFDGVVSQLHHTLEDVRTT